MTQRSGADTLARRLSLLGSCAPLQTMSSPSSPPMRVLLLGSGSQLASALIDGILQYPSLALTVLSRPLESAPVGDAAAEAALKAKSQVLDVLRARGVSVLHGSAQSGEDALVPLLTGFDVVLSALGTPAKDDQRIFIRAASKAGVRWFIPSTFGFDYDLQGMGGVLAPITDVKLEDLALIKQLGLDWTTINTGAFTEYCLRPVFGVNMDTRTIVFPASGAARCAQTAFSDVGRLTADAIATGRGRNQTIYTANGSPSYEEFAQMLERVTGESWTRVVRSKAESEAALKAPGFFASIIARFELAIGSTQPSPAVWPEEQNYNVKYGIKLKSVEEALREAVEKYKLQAKK